jgi:hypothetical protein
VRAVETVETGKGVSEKLVEERSIGGWWVVVSANFVELGTPVGGRRERREELIENRGIVTSPSAVKCAIDAANSNATPVLVFILDNSFLFFTHHAPHHQHSINHWRQRSVSTQVRASK